MREYKPRGMPSCFMQDAPAIVRKAIIDIIEIKPPAPCDFDIVFRDTSGEQIVGLDFDVFGRRGCHFFLAPHDARAYRERNRRKRKAWRDLPQATQTAILDYLAE